MLPVGKYQARALQAELGFADTGTEVVAVQFEVIDGEHKGARVTWRGYFTEKTARRSVESLKYAGWLGDWFTWEGLGSETVQLDVQEDRDLKSGEVRGTRVAWVNPARAPMKNSMDQSSRAQFAARMKGIVSEVLGSASAPQRPASPPRQPAPARRGGQGAPPREYGDGSEYGDGFDDNVPF